MFLKFQTHFELAKYFLERFTVKDEPYKVDVQIKEENGEYSYEENNHFQFNKNDLNFNSGSSTPPHIKSAIIKTEKRHKKPRKKFKAKKKKVEIISEEEDQESENSEYKLDFTKYNKKIREIDFTENTNGDIKFHCDDNSNEENDLDYSNDETITTTTSENYKCATCDKTFRDSRGLACHMNTVHGGSKYQCDFCEKNFTQSNNLKRHVAKQHEDISYSIPEDQKGHKCDSCGKSFSEARHLKMHIHIVHDGQKDTEMLPTS